VAGVRIVAVTDWTAAVRVGARIGHAIEAHDRIGSTNDRALAALSEPGGEGRAVLAELQVAGRGRRGRTWESPPGRNLTVSVALRPRLDATHAGRLGMAAALAVRTACAAHAELAIKWPNDLVAGDGRKVAGLLLETTLRGERLGHVVIGVGINLNWSLAEMPPEIAGTATSLLELAGHEVDRVALLRGLLAALDDEVAALEGGVSPLDRYRAASWLDGRAVAIGLGDEQLEGLVTGVNEMGSLVLETDAGRRVLASGEVVQVRDRAGVIA
jgi:BirA family biotin operon repressor/biotin-[acetyl-CoA-carboxylase] ligase